MTTKALRRPRVVVPLLKSQLVVGEHTRHNREAMLTQLTAVQVAQQQVLLGGGEHYVQRHRERGRLLPRERIELLLDPGSPFLELGGLAGYGTGDPLGGGMVTGMGYAAGRLVVVAANDPTVRGGSSSPTTIGKLHRIHEICFENRLPIINLTESAGADLLRQAEIFVPGGAGFRHLAELSAAGIPTLTLVFGSSTAGGAYVPGMSEYTVLVKGQAKVFLGGPPLVKMAIDEDADEEELGGAEMHARVSGLADYLAADELDALALGRQILHHLPASVADHLVGGEPPLCSPSELLDVIPADPREPYDVREVLCRLLDGSAFEEFKRGYGTMLVAGWGRLAGRRLGVLANNGILFGEEAQKGAQFIQLCNRAHTPILFVQNITGFMVGTKYEQGGIIKDGAKLINAVSTSKVPHFTLMVGASYGAGNYGMAGRAFKPRFVFTWPNHRIAVMGGRQLGGVMSIVKRQAAERAGRPYDEEADATERAVLEEQIEKESTALFATGRLWDDGIIDPRDTRRVLTMALAAVHNAPVRGAADFGVFRM